MKKSLLALAVLGAFAGAASAQSSVTVYGIVDLGINSTDSGATDGRLTGMTSGGQSASRIGFKGTEDLGNGLKANFVLEAGFNADDGNIATSSSIAALNTTTAGTAGLFSRVSTVGLSGNFGAVNMGRQTTVLKDAHDAIDPFGAAGSTGNIERIFYNGANPSAGRVSNNVKYTSNSFGGFKAQAAYTFGETRGDNGANRQYGLGLGYANGPLNVQFGYNNADTSNTTTPFATTAKSKVSLLGATYDFGSFKLHGAYADSRFENVTAATEVKVRNLMIGTSVKLGAAGTLLASYSVNDVRNTTNQDSTQAAIGYTHDLSKRTNLYTGYARTSNDSGAKLGGVTGAVNGNDVSVINVGIRHKF